MTNPPVETRADAPATVAVADPTSDTINAPGVSVEEAPVEAGNSEAEVKALRTQLEEQRRIQSGLDQANTRLQDQGEASQARIQELQTRLETYNTADGATHDALADYIGQLETVAAERDQWQKQAEEAIRSESRTRIVASEFPGLTPLIDADALPQATDDEDFRARLTALQTTFGSAAEARHAEKVRGAKPPAAPPSNQPGDINAIKHQMMNAEPGSDEFNRLRDQWYATLGVAS